MKFLVDYSQEKDIWNHLNTNWRFGYLKHGRRNIQNKLLKYYPKSYKTALNKATTEQDARKVIIDFLNSLPHITPTILAGLQAILNDKKDKIVHNLEAVYKKRFPFKKISVYLTTAHLNPYNYKERWFMTNINSSIQGHLKTVMHELNHFMFYYYYPDLKKELGQEKYEILKEALAIYTNPEGNDKPVVKKLENYFKQNLDKTIPEIIEKGKWRDYL
jgi:hypothetical protein